jgi:hypothetical protein
MLHTQQLGGAGEGRPAAPRRQLPQRQMAYSGSGDRGDETNPDAPGTADAPAATEQAQNDDGKVAAADDDDEGVHSEEDSPGDDDDEDDDAFQVSVNDVASGEEGETRVCGVQRLASADGSKTAEPPTPVDARQMDGDLQDEVCIF